MSKWPSDVDSSRPHVHLIGTFGSDLSVVNAARASYADASTKLAKRDLKLIKFLADHGHTSPFRHAAVQFELTTTLRERIRWETGPEGMAFYSAGQRFEPKLSTYMEEATIGIDDWISWRWTASLQALGQWWLAWADDELGWLYGDLLKIATAYFPYTLESLTGTGEDPHMVAIDSLRTNPALQSGPVTCLNDGYVRLVQGLQGQTPGETLVTFEVRAPLLVRSQWFKYVRDSAHDPAIVWDLLEGPGSGNGDDCDWGEEMYARNELSRRYVRDKVSFYLPDADAWRSAPESSKQGSGEPVEAGLGQDLSSWLTDWTKAVTTIYEATLTQGVAPEQARLFLPAYALYTNWYWTASMESVSFFLAQRLGHGAQVEIQEYAKAIDAILREVGLRA